MRSDNEQPGINRDNKQTNANKLDANNTYNNEINTGSVGFEGDGNNGASTLRVLRKKHASNNAPNEQKPQIP